MNRVEVRRGARAPEAVRLTVTNDLRDAEPFDFTTATAASIEVTDVRGVTRTWAAVMTQQSSSSVVVSHIFAADKTDVPKAGSFELMVLFTVPDGVRRAGPCELNVT
jgi:hypothetical protein